MSLLDTAKIENVLGRLGSVETDMGDPVVLADAARYRAALREHAFLKRLESAWSVYKKALSDLEGNESLLEDPDFRDEAASEIERLKSELPQLERKVLAALLPPDPLEARRVNETKNIAAQQSP